MLAIANAKDPREYLGANDIFPFGKQLAKRHQQEDCNDGKHGLRTTFDTQGGCKGDTFASW
jgi:hypothetical protein